MHPPNGSLQSKTIASPFSISMQQSGVNQPKEATHDEQMLPNFEGYSQLFLANTVARETTTVEELVTQIQNKVSAGTNLVTAHCTLARAGYVKHICTIIETHEWQDAPIGSSQWKELRILRTILLLQQRDGEAAHLQLETIGLNDASSTCWLPSSGQEERDKHPMLAWVLWSIMPCYRRPASTAISPHESRILNNYKAIERLSLLRSALDGTYDSTTLTEVNGLLTMGELDRSIRAEWKCRLLGLVVACLTSTGDLGCAVDLCVNELQSEKQLGISEKLVIFSLLSKLHSRRGDLERASKFLDELDRIGSRNALYGSVLRGLNAFTNGEYQEAHRYFEQSLNIQGVGSTRDEIPTLELGCGRLSQVLSSVSWQEQVVLCAANNLAISALFTYDMTQAIQVLETKVFQDNGIFLHPALVFNLCTLYDLALSTEIAMNRKTTLQQFVLQGRTPHRHLFIVGGNKVFRL